MLDGGDFQQQFGASGLSGVTVSQLQNAVVANESDIVCVVPMYGIAKATVPLLTILAAIPRAMVRRFICFSFFLS